MVTSTYNHSGPYLTNGTAQTYAVTMPIYQFGDIAVYLINTTTGVTVQLVLNTDYTVSGAQDPIGQYETSTVTLSVTTTTNLPTVPVPTGYAIVILRSLSLQQNFSVSDNSSYYPAVLEQALDYIVMQGQMLQELIQRGGLSLYQFYIQDETVVLTAASPPPS